MQAAKGVGNLDSMDKFINSQSQTGKENELEDQNDQVIRLQRYIGQLVQAKTLCDNRLRYLDRSNRMAGGPSKEAGVNESQYYEAPMSNTMMGQQVISLAFDAIMNSPFSRRYFYSYLEKHGKRGENAVKNNREQRPFAKSLTPPYHDLLGFWAAVEELKNSDKKVWHQLATEIFYTYINKPQDPWKVIKITRSDLKRIESFLVGDSGPDVFYSIQCQVLSTLEQEHYPAFLVSETCYTMLEDAQENGITLCEGNGGFVKSTNDTLVDFVTNEKLEVGNQVDGTGSQSVPSSGVWKDDTSVVDRMCPNSATSGLNTTAESILLNDHSSFAKSHLEHIGERLQNKTQALKALKSSLKPDSKVLTKLSDEVETLRSDRLEVEHHLLRMEAWSENLSHWRAHIQSVNHIEEDEILQVSIIVYVPTDSKSRISYARSNQQKKFDELSQFSETPSLFADSYPSNTMHKHAASALPTSWVCIKEVSDFHCLRRELIPYVSWIKVLCIFSHEYKHTFHSTYY